MPGRTDWTVNDPVTMRQLVRLGLDPQKLSHDLAIVDAYSGDSLVHDRISVRLFVEVDKAGQWAMENAPMFNLPLLLMHGSGDQITSVDATQQFAEQVPRDCTLKIWPGLYHELHNEPEKEAIIACLINWLKAQIPTC